MASKECRAAAWAALKYDIRMAYAECFYLGQMKIDVLDTAVFVELIFSDTDENYRVLSWRYQQKGNQIVYYGADGCTIDYEMRKRFREVDERYRKRKNAIFANFKRYKDFKDREHKRYA